MNYIFPNRKTFVIHLHDKRKVLIPGKREVSKGWLNICWREGWRERSRQWGKLTSVSPRCLFADEVTLLARVSNHWCRIANTLSAEIGRLVGDKADRRRGPLSPGVWSAQSDCASPQAWRMTWPQSLASVHVSRPSPILFDFVAIRNAAKEQADLPGSTLCHSCGPFQSAEAP